MPIEQDQVSSTPALALLKQRLSKFETEEGRMKGLSYLPRPNDIVISTAAKAGTTWRQQICHQMRSADAGGDMCFDEISAVVPWIELAADQGQDLEAAQYGENDGKPRLFKTHLWAEHCPAFPKTIVVFRSPFDVVVSFYKFFEDWFFEAGTIDLSLFAEEFWLARGAPTSPMQNSSYFTHLTSWYNRRNHDDVLIVFFEDLKEDLKGQIQRVARFISNEKHNFEKPNVIDLAHERATFNFMKANDDNFDEKLSKLARNEACGLAKNAGMSGNKISSGKVGSGSKLLPEGLRRKVQLKWEEVVMPATGCCTYEELRQKLNAGTEGK